MINKKKVGKTILIILGLAFFLFIIIKVIVGIIATNKSFEEDLPSSYLLPSHDSLLIKSVYRHKIKINVIHNSKTREPISMLFFDQDYHIIIHKINLINDESLQKIFHTQIKNATRSIGYPYNLYGDKIFFYFQCKTGFTHPVSEVYLTLNGDSLKSIAENDSVVAYHLLCKNFSIRYEEKGPIDVFIKGKEDPLGQIPLIPMDVLFLKRQKSIYLLLLTSNNPFVVVPPELLYNIVIQNSK